MEFHCMTWIQHFWCQLVFTLWIRIQGDIKCLSDDLIVEILGRLPADEVLKCRKVCTKWRALTSTRQFAEEHLKHTVPMLFLQDVRKENKLGFYFLDEKVKGKILKNVRNERVCIKFMENALNDRPLLVGSCDGLLVFEDYKAFNKLFVCNPVTQEVVTLMKPSQDCRVHGIFFHSSTREYRLLLARALVSGHREYFILNIGSKSWRGLGTFDNLVSSLASVNSNKSLHWVVERGITSCSNSLLVFDPDLEKFKVLPHPGRQCCSKLCEKAMLLSKVEMDGLSLGILHFSFMDIWILKDHEKWSWSMTHRIDFDYLDLFGEQVIFGPNVTIGDVQNNELLLVGYLGGIFRYNLYKKTFRKLYEKYTDKTQIIYLQDRKLRICSYRKSLVSLKDLYGG